MKIKCRSIIATVVLLTFITSTAMANPGENNACNGCHTYSPQSINITTDINSIIVSPNESFVVNLNWSVEDTSGVTEINWPANFENIAITRDNTLFNPHPNIPSSISNIPGGTTGSTLTAPHTPGTYTVRVYASRGSNATLGKVTDFKDITVIVRASYNVSLNVDSVGKTTSPGVNATYKLTINNTGNALDNYTLVVFNPDNAAVGLTNTRIENLAAGANAIVLLNVTSATEKTFRVDVTANSTGDPSKIAIVNTTTKVSVPSVYGVSLIVDSNAKTTSPGVNATYKLTINNSGSTVDNYTLVVSNPDGASVGLTSTQIQKLAPGANAIILLNVTNASAGITFRVNVTANSTGDPDRTASVNTTTTVNQQTGGAPKIISYSPSTFIFDSVTYVLNEVGDSRNFNIKINQSVNVTWYIYGIEVFNQSGVTGSSYTNTSAAAGFWNVEAKVSNKNGSDSKKWIWIVSETYSGNKKTQIRIKPETLNLASKGKFTASIRLPEGYDVDEINLSTVMCEGAPAIKGKVKKIGNVLEVKFNRQDLVNVSPGNAVWLTVTGMLMDGTTFEGSDIIRVINKGNGNDDEVDEEDVDEEDKEDVVEDNDEENEEDVVEDDDENEIEEHSEKVNSNNKRQEKKKDSDKVESNSREQGKKKDSDKVNKNNKGQGKKKDSNTVRTNSKGKKIKLDKSEVEEDDNEDDD